MSESVAQSTEGNQPKAAKDKKCPYCGQAFTSSSLGRHLDLYIKDKNPKPPDGLHDVDEIKKLRGNITRRQPRGSLGAQRDDSTPAGTPRQTTTRRATPVQDTEVFKTSSLPKDGQYAVDSTLSKYPFTNSWQASEAATDISSKNSWDGKTPQDGNKRPGLHRAVSKQVAQKQQFDVKQKLADAMDTARAAELALRELVSSWRAAKQQIDSNSMPFDFDPLSLDFPALTLQCLQPPPTLFSSTQHPTSTSWSVQSPGQREFLALQAYFQEQFNSWRISCASATTVVMEEMVYPSTGGPFRDTKEAVKQAEKSADLLEKNVTEHLQSAYAVWETLPQPRRNELWVLELARGVGRKQKEMDKMKDQQEKLRQENANLKSHIGQLNRSQQPREYRLLLPTTIALEREAIAHAYQQGVKGAKYVGFEMEDRHLDLSVVVAKSIERWKNVITSTRVSSIGMTAQRPLEQPSVQTPAGTAQNSPPDSQSTAPTPQMSQHQPAASDKRLSTASTNGPASEQTAPSTTNTGPPSVEEISDQDADAEMEDDDSFAMMTQSPIKPAHPPMQQQPQLEVPRTRGPVSQQQQQQHQQAQQQAQQQQQRNAAAAAEMRFMMQNGAGSPVGRTAMAMNRTMPNMNMAAMQANAMHGADMTIAMQGVRSDMYLE